MKKDFLALLILHVLLFIGSCSSEGSEFDDCNCPDGTFEAEISDFSLVAHVDREFNLIYGPNSYSNVAPIESKGVVLSVYLDYLTNKISMGTKAKGSNSFGFQGAYACTCAPPPTMVLDPITAITILQWDAELEESKDVTEAFGELFLTNDWDGPINSINESLSKSKELQEDLYFTDSFAFVIEDPTLIENEGYFQVEFTLESGKKIEQFTPFFIFQ